MNTRTSQEQDYGTKEKAGCFHTLSDTFPRCFSNKGIPYFHYIIRPHLSWAQQAEAQRGQWRALSPGGGNHTCFPIGACWLALGGWAWGHREALNMWVRAFLFQDPLPWHSSASGGEKGNRQTWTLLLVFLASLPICKQTYLWTNLMNGEDWLKKLRKVYTFKLDRYGFTLLLAL